MLRIISICTLIIFCLTFCDGQKSNFQIDHIGYADGLPSQIVKDLTKDDNGNLWIITEHDLIKYDGYTTTIFNSKNSIFKNLTFQNVLRDSEGNIWIKQYDALSHQGLKFNDPSTFNEIHLYVIDNLTEEISPFETFIDAPFKESEIISIDKIQNELFLTLKNGDVYKYENELKFCFTVPDFSQYLGIGKNQNYFSFDFKNSLLIEKSFSQTLKNQIHISDYNSNSSIEVGENGNLFYQNSYSEFGNIKIYNEGKWEHKIQFKKNDLNKASNRIELGLIKLVDNSQYNTMLLCNQIHINFDNKDLYRNQDYSFKHIHDFYIDEFNIIYLATNIGIAVIKPQQNIFNHFMSGDSLGNSVRSVIYNEDLKVGKSINGQYWSSPNGKYSTDFINSENLSNGVIDIYRDPKNENWVWELGWMPSPTLIDLKEQKITTVSLPYKIGTHIKTVRSPESEKLYCLGTSGIIVNKKHPDQWERVFFPIENSNSAIDKAYSVQFLNGKMLLGTEIGLVAIDEEKHIGNILWASNPEDPKMISFIHLDQRDENILWLGTLFNGIIKLNHSTGASTTYDTESGLSNNNVHAILEDNNENLWISTNKYLNCLSKDLKTNHVYTQEDGISHNEFNKYSYYLDSVSGTFIFGGLNGYTYFNPDSVKDIGLVEPHILFPRIEKRKSDGQIEIIKNTKNEIPEFDLSEKDLSINFYLNTNQIFQNELNRFEYRIPGFQNQWKTISGNEFSLRNLPYGSYRLEFIANRNRNFHRSKIRTAKLNFLKPYYKRMWFFLLSFILIGLLIWLYIRVRTKNISKRNRELEQLVKERTSELNLSNETKNKLFAILAHDIRNPISSLSNITDKIKFLTKRNRIDELNILANDTQKKVTVLNNSLNNILHWALVTMGKIELRPEPVSLLNEIEDILKLYKTEIEEKSIYFDLLLNDREVVQTDRGLIQIVLRNIISNAIKYSYPEGKVKIKVSPNLYGGKKLFIDDEGIGLNPTDDLLEKNESWFNNHGSGIGLILTQELTKIAGITFILVPRKEIGTRAELLFPSKT